MSITRNSQDSRNEQVFGIIIKRVEISLKWPILLYNKSQTSLNKIIFHKMIIIGATNVSSYGLINWCVSMNMHTISYGSDGICSFCVRCKPTQMQCHATSTRDLTNGTVRLRCISMMFDGMLASNYLILITLSY